MIQLTAKTLVPTAITSAMLVSCTVAEPASGETEWNAATSYTVGDVAVRTTVHKRYKRLIAGTTATPPESDTSDPPVWLDIGATNRWSQFDRKVGTVTSVPSGDLVTVLQPGSVEGIALLELTGTSVRVVMTDRPAGPGAVVVYDSGEISLDATPISSVYDWMYAPMQQRLSVVLTDLPGQFPSCEVTVTVRSTSGAACGVLAVGRVIEIGATEYDAGAGIINFGKVNDDGFGNREWVEGDWANRVTLPLLLNRADFARVHRQLARLRSTPCIYIGSSMRDLEPLVCYGVFRDLYITVPYYPLARLALEVDGLNNI